MAVELNLIKECAALVGLPDSVQQDIAQQASLIFIPRDTQIFDCGETCAALPLVLSGSIRVFKQSETGREISLYRVNKDQICVVTLGCLFGGEAYPATSIAEEEVKAITLPRNLFLSLIESQNYFREFVFHLFADRLSVLMQLIDAITFHKLDQRLAAFLVKNGPLINDSHQQIADELGSVREIVSRLLKQFEERGWVKLARKQIEVLETSQLEKYFSDT